jgi:hypothetical protein
MPDKIFARRFDVTPTQLAAVADRRFRDAEALCEMGHNERANGAVYLCGIVIEILLKSQLLRRYGQTARKRPHDPMDENEREVWSLIWRSHDLAEMLDRNPELAAAVQRKGQDDGHPYLDWLRAICGEWTIYVRYSSFTTDIGSARDMISRVRFLKEVLK